MNRKNIGVFLIILIWAGPMVAVSSQDVTEWLDQIELGQPVVSGIFTVFPIRASGKKDSVGLVTLEQALDNNRLRITELDGGNVPEVLITNLSGHMVYIMGGEILTGCKQDRLVGRDILIRPRARKVVVPVFCVEAGRWTASSREFSSEKNLGTYHLRSMAQDSTPGTQGKIWAAVDELNAKAGISSSTGAYQDAYRDRDIQKKLEETEKAIDLLQEEDILGVMIGIGDSIISLDIFADPFLFSELWPKIRKSATLAGINVNNDAGFVTRKHAESFLTEVSLQLYTRRRPVDIGNELASKGGELSVNVLSYQSKLLHLAAFPRSNSQDLSLETNRVPNLAGPMPVDRMADESPISSPVSPLVQFQSGQNQGRRSQ